jgi:hypothetical protein
MKKFVIYGAKSINAETTLKFLSERGQVVAFSDSNKA